MVYVNGGRIKTTTALPTANAPNAIPFKDGAICVGPGVAPRSWLAGIGYGTNGRICIDTTGLAITAYLGGLGFTSTGALACDTTGAVVGSVRGIPMTAQGRICIETPTP